MTDFGPSCPWYDSLQRHGPANIKWCEQRVCAWINEPANAWSNVAYLLAAAWIWRRARARGSRGGAAFAGIVAFMGLMSFYYHATNNFLTQALDFLGMFAMLFFLLAGNAVRLGAATRRGALASYAAGCVLFTAALWPLDRLGFKFQWLVALFAVLFLATELAARAKEGRADSLRFFWAAAAALAAGEACSLLDATRVWCDPSNHWLQGHAVWHCFGGLGMALLYAHAAPDLAALWDGPAAAAADAGAVTAP
jgi:hypothetical protein